MTIPDQLAERLRDALERELPAAIALRHRLHADPRPSGHEGDTTEAVVDALGAGPGLVTAGTGRAVLFGNREPNTASIALRAELDALPIVELSDVAWRASGPYMHACGHDVHLAALVAVVRAIARSDAPFPVTALLQPREEGAPSGARDVVASGVLAALGVRAVVGAHVQPRLAAGTAAITPGLVNASVDEFELLVTGRGGHVGYPHTVADPVLALAAIVVNLQQIAARRIDPVAGAVCIVTEVHAGSATNVVAGQALARGTLRLMRDEDRPRMATALTEIATHTALAHGCTVAVRVIDGEPALVNDRDLAARVTDLLGAAGYATVTDFRSFGADDFSYYCRTVPSLMIFVGADGVGLHDARFVPPDSTVRAVADALLAGYLAACERFGASDSPQAERSKAMPTGDLWAALEYALQLTRSDLKGIVARSGDPERAWGEITRASWDAGAVAGMLLFTMHNPIAHQVADARRGEERGPGRWVPEGPWPEGSEMARFREVFVYLTSLEPHDLDGVAAGTDAERLRRGLIDALERLETQLFRFG